MWRVCNLLGCCEFCQAAVVESLRPVFDARNRIIHELDIDFESGIRNGTPRSRKDMTEYSNTLLEIGEEIVKAVEDKRGSPSPQ